MVKDKCKFGRLMYMFEATLEYFVAILVTGTFLATLTKELGISDSLTGIISSFISLGCLFQLFSVLVRRKRMKGFVIFMSIANQVLFMLLYVLPLTHFSKTTKTILFSVIIVAAYIIYYVAHPKKINWMMSLVEDRQRGRFTANKEILSLITGIAFTYGMGWVMDHLLESGNKRMAFLVGGIVIFVIMVSHTLTMVFTIEKQEDHPKRDIMGALKEIVKNKAMLKITVVFVLYYMATYAVTPFFGTYTISELGLSLKVVVVLTMVGSISRILVSWIWGKYADKNGFAKMIEKCFLVLILAYIVMVFANPSTGVVMYALYNFLHGIGLGGVNSALINLVYDYVEPEKRADSLAVCQATAGTVGFFATLAMSPIMAAIQKGGNRIFGITVYSQQLFSLFGALIFVAAAIYVRKVMIKKR